MNYLKDLGEALKAMLVGLEENKQKEIIRFVQSKIYSSYKNGIATGRTIERKAEPNGKGRR